MNKLITIYKVIITIIFSPIIITFLIVNEIVDWESQWYTSQLKICNKQNIYFYKLNTTQTR